MVVPSFLQDPAANSLEKVDSDGKHVKSGIELLLNKNAKTKDERKGKEEDCGWSLETSRDNGLSRSSRGKGSEVAVAEMEERGISGETRSVQVDAADTVGTSTSPGLRTGTHIITNGWHAERIVKDFSTSLPTLSPTPTTTTCSSDNNNNKNSGESNAQTKTIHSGISLLSHSSSTAYSPLSLSSSSQAPEPSPSPAYVRRRKRARSLRKKVLLRTRGAHMSSTNSGIVITSNTASITTSATTAPAATAVTSSPNTSSSSLGLSTASNPPQPSTTSTEEDNLLLQLPPPSDPRYPSLVTTSSPWVPTPQSSDPLADTVWWGYFILISTWLVFTIGMGSILGMWDWTWDVGVPLPTLPTTAKIKSKQTQMYKPEEDDLPIPGYYPALIILTMVMAWVWVVVAWVGMKYFKHAKIQPQTEVVG